MARSAKSADNLQVFRGSKARLDVFAQNSGTGCCNSELPFHDKLADRVRFDNALAHLNPTGANDKFVFPFGAGNESSRQEIVDHINRVGVGASISVLAIPTYAFLTGIGVHVAAEEPGLTFAIGTRNGLTLPNENSFTVSAVNDPLSPCGITRTQTAGAWASSFGGLDGARFVDHFARGCCDITNFSLEADEIILTVATMPAGGVVTGEFELIVTASYDILNRAEA